MHLLFLVSLSFFLTHCAMKRSQPETQNNSIFTAINKPEWGHLQFRVIELDKNWDNYHAVSDYNFVRKLNEFLINFSKDQKVQTMMTTNTINDTSLLNNLKNNLLNIISETKKKFIPSISTPSDSFDKLEEGLRRATEDQLFSVAKYCLQKKKDGNNYIPNPAIADVSYSPNYIVPPYSIPPEGEKNYVALVFDKEEDLPVMSVNIYPSLSKTGEKYQEHRFISRNHTYSLILVLKGKKAASNLSLHLHAAALKARKKDFFVVKPMDSMFTILRDYAEEVTNKDYDRPCAFGYLPWYKTNSKFKQFADDNLQSLSK